MVSNMKQEKFEELLSLYGTDISQWPEKEVKAAELYAATEVGHILLETENELGQLMEASIAMGPETANDSNSDAFLYRLADIPQHHAQDIISRETFVEQFKNLFAETFQFSTLSYAVQAFAFVAVLSVGIMVGAQSATAEIDTSEIDISENWFASATVIEEME